MLTTGLVGVTGATGALGGRVASRLAARGVSQRLIVRDLTRAPELRGAEVAQADYRDRDAMRTALAGIGTLLLVSATETEGRVALHRAAIDAAIEAGVERIVYTSFYGASEHATFTFARDHWHTEEYLRERGIRHTILRDNLYLDVIPLFVLPDGTLRGPAGDGRFAGVTRDDIADVATTILTAAPGTHDGRTYDLTGPQSLSFAELAEELSRATGRPIRYHAETVEEAYASRAGYGAPAWQVEGWVTTYLAVANGELEKVTGDVAAVTGKPPMSFAEFLASDPPELRRLRERTAADG